MNMNSMLRFFSRSGRKQTLSKADQLRFKRIEEECKGDRGHNADGKPTHLTEAKSLFTTVFDSKKLRNAENNSRLPDLYKSVNVAKGIVSSWVLYNDVTWQLSIVFARLGEADSKGSVQDTGLQSSEGKEEDPLLRDPFFESLRKMNIEELKTLRKTLKTKQAAVQKLQAALWNYYHDHVVPGLTFNYNPTEKYFATMASYNGSDNEWKRFHIYYYEDGANSAKVSKENFSFDDLKEIDGFDAEGFWKKMISFFESAIAREKRTEIFVSMVATAWACVLMGKSLLLAMPTNVASACPNHDKVLTFAKDAVIKVLPWDDEQAAEEWMSTEYKESDDVMAFVESRRLIFK